MDMPLATAQTVRQEPRTPDDAARMRCSEALCGFLANNGGVLGAVMAWVDGRAFADAVHADGEAEAARIAAISSSLLALSESFSGEALGGRARYSSIVTDRGSIVTVRVPSRTRAHVLCVWIDNSENFATALRFALDTATRLARILDDTE